MSHLTVAFNSRQSMVSGPILVFALVLRAFVPAAGCFPVSLSLYTLGYTWARTARK